MSSQPPKSNISKRERSGFSDLSKNMNIFILSADKGKATVVMNTNEYENSMIKTKSFSSDYKRKES